MADSATRVSAANHRFVVAVPYPGRGHINPMLSLCNQIISKSQHITKILVIVTEEWQQYLNSESNNLPNEISFATIPNVLPSELVRVSDIPGFFKAVQDDMEKPVEQIFGALKAPPDLIIADACLGWALDIANRRNVKLASFWTASVTSFLLAYHYQLLRNFFPETGKERIDFIPGIRSIRASDLPELCLTNKTRASYLYSDIFIPTTKAQCIIFRSLNELESPAIKALKTDLSTPTFAIGPAIPYCRIPHKSCAEEPSYITWLNSQQERSVLYLSLGSFHSTSAAQMDELAAGLKESGVPFLWAARDKTRQLRAVLGDEKGMVVPWCDQMKVLCHSSVGGFFTHCGWNSAAETAFAGVPVLCFPLDAEQPVNGKIMVEDWGIGRRVKDGAREFVGREAVSRMLNKFMDLECSERKEMDRASKELQERLLVSVSEDGSSSGLDRFLSRML